MNLMKKNNFNSQKKIILQINFNLYSLRYRLQKNYIKIKKLRNKITQIKIK